MANRKMNARYYFTVEGETEKWYLEWLRDAINADPRSKVKVVCSPKVQKNPVKGAKAKTNLDKSAKVFHVFDFEDEEPIHVKAFKDTLANMKKAGSLGRGFRYVSAYSNLTFELWMVLHKGDCPALAHRRQYLKPINDLYGEHFESLDEYKHEANFKRVLGKLTVDDAVTAVGRAETLAKRAEEHGLRKAQHCGYSYYLDNPATDLWIPVKQMLEEGGIIDSRRER